MLIYRGGQFLCETLKPAVSTVVMRTWHNVRRAHVAGNLARGLFCEAAKIPPKFSTLSSSMSIPPYLVTFPTSSPSTAPNYPVNFHRPQLRERACRRAGTNRIISNYLISCNRPSAWLSPLAIFFLWLSGAISPPGSPVCPLSATEPPNSDCADKSPHLQSQAFRAYNNSFHIYKHICRLSRQKLFGSKAVLMIAVVITKAPKNLLVCLPQSLSFCIVSTLNKPIWWSDTLTLKWRGGIFICIFPTDTVFICGQLDSANISKPCLLFFSWSSVPGKKKFGLNTLPEPNTTGSNTIGQFHSQNLPWPK